MTRYMVYDYYKSGMTCVSSFATVEEAMALFATATIFIQNGIFVGSNVFENQTELARVGDIPEQVNNA